MGAEMERQAILRVYTSPAWNAKVAKMSDAQVVAIYLRMKAQNKL